MYQFRIWTGHCGFSELQLYLDDREIDGCLIRSGIVTMHLHDQFHYYPVCRLADACLRSGIGQYIINRDDIGIRSIMFRIHDMDRFPSLCRSPISPMTRRDQLWMNRFIEEATLPEPSKITYQNNIQTIQFNWSLEDGMYVARSNDHWISVRPGDPTVIESSFDQFSNAGWVTAVNDITKALGLKLNRHPFMDIHKTEWFGHFDHQIMTKIMSEPLIIRRLEK